ncbi:peptide/nickel transport system permease protein [Hasllibacter halocynthiae]|uniref:Peptide/nickel transport system permease protein n=1 Tax=Hasllibacter halocynthiae TaxID=595589 RepID=A0A2T0X293_9RHOB|nr:ABC transporter permease [Hasllibacter halocynthiae]PRY93058.1 peptide/nickel transport system permease protein [Hasllibacter halocynthiae]
MLSYILRRILQSVIVLLVVGLVAFSMFRFVGDPIEQLLGQERTQADVDRLREALGLNEPFVVQYLGFLGRAIQGDFGISYRQARPVAEILLERAPATLELALVSGIIAVVLGIALGVFTAIRREGFAANAIMTVSLIGVSLPTFLIGVLLIWFFGIGIEIPVPWGDGTISTKLFPTFGRGEVVDLGWWTTGLLTESGRASLVLPAITLGLYQMTLIMRLVRSEMLEVLRQDYIRFARARGLKARVVNFRHALKNTLVPVITIIGLQLGAIIAFAIITETVFQWPGVGLLFINAVQFVDIPVMAAYLMLVSVMFVVINLIVDLLYVTVDPRLRIDGGTA